jgi:hypothetical protein
MTDPKFEDVFQATEKAPSVSELYAAPPAGWASGWTLGEPIKYSKWKCYLFGNHPGAQGIVWTPLEGQEPNAFWRFMQWLVFGNYWRYEP